MTTRTRLYLYHLIGAASVVGTLLAVNPALAALPLGFAAVYLGGLLVLYMAGWMVGIHRARGWLRWTAMLVGCYAMLALLGMIGGIDAGVIALLLAPVSLWPRRMV